MHGRGVHTDWGRAEQYFSAAAKHGHPSGQRMVEVMRSPRAPSSSSLSSRPYFESDCANAGGYVSGSTCQRGGAIIDYR